MRQDSPRPVGVALAGGWSRRMGHDKAYLQVGGISLLERAIASLGAVSAAVVVADRGRGLLPGYRSLPDGPGAGPVAGILGAAAECPGEDLLVLACDLPAVTSALLGCLAEPIDEDAHVPRWNRGPEPLCALYRPAALALMSAEARAGRLALHAMLRQERLKVRYLDGRRLAAFGSPEEIFLNVNTPDDLASVAFGRKDKA